MSPAEVSRRTDMLCGCSLICRKNIILNTRRTSTCLGIKLTLVNYDHLLLLLTSTTELPVTCICSHRWLSDICLWASTPPENHLQFNLTRLNSIMLVHYAQRHHKILDQIVYKPFTAAKAVGSTQLPCLYVMRLEQNPACR
jgi:hypothetical protein